jgi:hypothetical protein
MARGDEKRWVESIRSGLEQVLQAGLSKDKAAKVSIGYPLCYAHEIMQYDQKDHPTCHRASYETDILIYDEEGQGNWIPRVVIECKLGAVTTHDALTYSSKAATHKHVHPYLRYGILIGNWQGYPLPPRLARHGAFFDFMAVLEGTEPSQREWNELGGVLCQEVVASRKMQLLLSRRSAACPSYWLLHRPLILEQTPEVPL